MFSILNSSLFLFALTTTAVVFAQDTPSAVTDEIKALPGWDGALPSRHYAGHVNAGTATEAGVAHQMYEHYYFVESENDPANDPLIVWTNGGPGASSMFGLFVELGPFYLDASSLATAEFNKTGIPSIYRNEYAWTKKANVLIINSPPPIGYSYCEPAGQTGDGYSCGTWNDTKTAVHNEIYLESWLQRFPRFKKNDWYLIGESYAGVYIPMLARRILNNPASNISNMMKGFAVGDGCVGSDVLCGARGPGPLFHLEFFRGHGQFSDKLYHKTKTTCPYDQLLGYGVQVTNKDCQALLSKVDDQIGAYYAYNLYDACWYQNSLEPPKHNQSARTYWSSAPSQSALLSAAAQNTARTTSLRRSLPAVNDYPCDGPQAMFVWVQTPEVKAALHVAPDANFFSGDNGVGFTYNITETNLMPFYTHIAQNTDLRVLVYNGDTDPGINSFVAQNWTSSLGLDEIEEWRPWTLDGNKYMGGYVTRYAGNFDFLTIRGSGHMVPEFKPKVTLEFLSKWLDNKAWQTLNTTSTSFAKNVVEL